MSGLVILMTLIGGMGTFVGPVVGAAVIVALENKLGDIGDYLAAATGVEWFRAIGVSVTLVTGPDLHGVRSCLPPRRARRTGACPAACAAVAGARPPWLT